MVHYLIQDMDNLTRAKVKEQNGFGLKDKVKLAGGRVGVVCFVGETLLDGGDWVGLCLDKKEGDNDGSIQGTRYFTCKRGHGLFVRPSEVELSNEDNIGEEMAIPLEHVDMDDPVIDNFLSEIARVFECRVCLGYKPTMVMCAGCGHMTTCRDCKKKLEQSTTNKCPGCLHDWSANTQFQVIETRSFHYILQTAAAVQKEQARKKRKREERQKREKSRMMEQRLEDDVEQGYETAGEDIDEKVEDTAKTAPPSWANRLSSFFSRLSIIH